jgi:ABC-2 type transport system ATP-binding protein
VVGKANGRVVLELAGGADEQALLDAARRAGRVTHFSAVERTLAELFRQAVQQ